MTSRSSMLRLAALLLPLTVVAMFLSMLVAASASATLPACNGGGRIVNSGALVLSDCTISVPGTSGDLGGGVYNDGDLTLINVVVSGNSTTAGGGGIYNNGTLTLTNVVVTGNTSGDLGGGIFNDFFGTVYMTNVTVTNNTAATGGGGIANSGSAIGSGLAVANNTTTTGDGGGILNDESFCLSAGTDFNACFDNPSGGNGFVSGNHASAGNGGGIANEFGGTVALSDSTVDGNQAGGGDGGGIWTLVATTELVNVTISNNTATGNGGGLFNDTGSVCCTGSGPYDTNLTIALNQAGGNGGGVYTTGGGFTTLASSTIADNTAAGSGGGVYDDFSSTELQNTLLARNGGNCVGTIVSDGSNLDTGTTCAFANAGDQTNVGDANVGLLTLAAYGGPTQGSSQFLAGGVGGEVVPGLSTDMRTQALKPTSPAIDAGSVTCPATDERGVTRPQDGNVDGISACDIGAFELTPCLTVDKTCAVVPPPPPFTCKTPITAVQMQWEPGSMTDPTRWVLTQPGQVIDIKAWNGKAGSSTLVSTQCGINPGDIVTVTGLGAQADAYWQIYQHVGTCVPGNPASVTGTLLGQSGFHVGGGGPAHNCEDTDMNSADDCGKPEGDLRITSGQTNLINDWLLQGMNGSNSTNANLICNPAAGPAQQNCVAPIGGANVLYTYTVANIGPKNVTGTLIDKVGSTTVAGPISFTINAGDPPQSFSSTQTITKSTTNVVTASGNNDATCTATDSVTVNVACTLYYPYTSSNPLTSTAFNESTVLKAFQPVFASPGDTIRTFYSDEHALTLGVRQVIVKTTTGTTTTNFALATPPTTAPLSAAIDPNNPAIGSTATSGDNAAIDGFRRPIYPAIFITDLTTNGDAACSAPDEGPCGDWQYGGTPQYPSFISGMWKGAVKTVDKTKTPNVVAITTDADPAKNTKLGPGADPIPSGVTNEGYLTEVRWNVNDLKVDTSTGTGTNAPLGGTVVSLSTLAGHTFRVQFMVHDGDQNKTGGDVGQNCSAVSVPISQ